MIFLDTAKPEEIKKWSHVIDGVTCNPLILSRERPGEDPQDVLRSLLDVTAHEISFQVWSADRDLMVAEAKWIVDQGAIVKLPMTEIGLRVAGELTESDEPLVNFTGIMSAAQVLVACANRAKYASLFWGRARRLGINAAGVIRDTAEYRRNRETLVLVGSIASAADAVDAFAAGADVVTVQPAILEQLIHNSRTEETIAEFLDAFGKSR